uniref:Heat shock 70 kDa protein 13 n=1 Tax=Scolopendra viridis TaxID=118503 RepID=A0A4D5R9S8_SCOVI
MSYTITIFGSSVIALLLAGYLAQNYLPPPVPKIVGIDLGTTYSCIAVYEAVTGKVRVIDVKGHKTIPSIVAFGKQKTLVGNEALAQIEKNAKNTIYDAKRFIGKFFSQNDLISEGLGYQFKIVQKNGRVSFPIILGNNVTEISPEMVGAEVIKVLREAAEANLNVPVTKAVMAVPAEFDELQRNYTKLAAKLAGIEVLRIINEPTAAALAYGLHKKDSVRNVIVIDIGGGTSDISLLNIQGGMFLTQSMAGNNHLGGQDFNQRLLNHLLKIIEEKYLFKLNSENLQRLRLAVENAKLNLTEDSHTEMKIPLKSQSSYRSDFIFNYNLTRKTFEIINEDLFNKVIILLDTVLRPVELTPEEVDEIVLVGGSTRIPRIRQLIAEYFGKAANVGIDPELAVAYGVAIQAGIIGGMWPLQVSAIEIQSKFKKIHIK